MAIHAEWSRKASLLRPRPTSRPTSSGLTDAEAQGHGGGMRDGWEGGAFQARGGASAKATSHSVPGCTGAGKASVETEATGLTGFLRPCPLLHTASSVASAPPALREGATQISGTEATYGFPTFQTGALNQESSSVLTTKETPCPGTYPATRRKGSVTSPLTFTRCVYNENPIT